VPATLPKNTVLEEPQKETIYYVSNKQNETDEIREEKKSPKPEKKIKIAEIKKDTSPSITSPLKKKDVISPIEIVINPKKETPPKGYKETIQSVVTGKYFRDALWVFPIIIDMERVEPR